MNKEVMLRVADAIEASVGAGRENVGFDMTTYKSSNPSYGTRPDAWGCGTVACIAGWTVLVERGKEEFDDVYGFSMDCIAEDILGLDGDQSRFLFGGYWSSKTKDLSAEAAVCAMRKMVEVGGVFDHNDMPVLEDAECD